MPTYDVGLSGLVGTVGVTILNAAGTVLVVRSTAGITEPVSGSGTYYVADYDPTAVLTYVWDVGAGTMGASETVGPAATGRTYAILSDANYGNAKLVRSTTPANTLSVDANHKAPATIAAGDIATDAIAAAVVKADAVTKIQAGLSTYTGGPVASVIGNVGGSVASVTAGVTLAANQDVRNVGGTLPDVNLAATQTHYVPAKPGDKMDLVDAPNATAITAIVSAVNSLATYGLTALNYLLVTTGIKAASVPSVTLAATQGSYAPAKPGDAMTLTTAYDAAKSAASQTSVDEVNADTDELLSAVAAIPINPYTGTPPSASEIKTAIEASGSKLQLIDTKTTNLPAVPASKADADAATAAANAAKASADLANRTAPSTFNPATDTVARVTLVDTTTTNVDMVKASAIAADVARSIGELPLSDAGARLLAASVVGGLGSLQMTIKSPVVAGGALELYQGDDYYAVEARSIGMDIDDGAHLLLLDQAGAKVKLYLSQATWTATSVSSITGGYRASFEASAANTAALSAGTSQYQLKAVSPDGHTSTEQKGPVTVFRSIPAVS